MNLQCPMEIYPPSKFFDVADNSATMNVGKQ